MTTIVLVWLDEQLQLHPLPRLPATEETLDIQPIRPATGRLRGIAASSFDQTTSRRKPHYRLNRSRGPRSFGNHHRQYHDPPRPLSTRQEVPNIDATTFPSSWPSRSSQSRRPHRRSQHQTRQASSLAPRRPLPADTAQVPCHHGALDQTCLAIACFLFDRSSAWIRRQAGSLMRISFHP